MGCSVFEWDRVAASDTRFAIIIPARFGSTRYPGKPLAMLTGADGRGRPLIERSWRAACAVAGAQGVWVATDDLRVAGVVRGFGGQVVMTSADCRNGTERCAQAARLLGLTHEIIVNFQGDAPLTPAHVVEGVVEALARDPEAGMATAAIRCCARTYAHMLDEAAQGAPAGSAWWSMGVIMRSISRGGLCPLCRTMWRMRIVRCGCIWGSMPIGRRPWRSMRGAPSVLEEMEGLEQLRCLDRGIGVRVVSFEPEAPMVELNNPQDVAVIEDLLVLRGVS
jgi:3-deoxy-manno-octulosonate cytidylyltransferase (CMP-KDO synthetase)